MKGDIEKTYHHEWRKWKGDKEEDGDDGDEEDVKDDEEDEVDEVDDEEDMAGDKEDDQHFLLLLRLLFLCCHLARQSCLQS